MEGRESQTIGPLTDVDSDSDVMRDDVNVRAMGDDDVGVLGRERDGSEGEMCERVFKARGVGDEVWKG